MNPSFINTLRLTDITQSQTRSGVKDNSVLRSMRSMRSGRDCDQNSFLMPSHSFKQSFLVEQKKQDAKTFLDKHKKRKRRELMIKVGTYIFFGVELGFLAVFFTLSYKEFFFGTMLCILLNMVNFCVFMIYKAIVNPVVKPFNDPGILVWWLCCIRLGHSKKYRKKPVKSKQQPCVP